MQKKQILNYLSDCYHGKDSIASQKKMFMAGQGVYARLFSKDCSPTINGNTVSEYSLILHSYLVRQDDRIVKVGSTITEDIISSSTLRNMKQINGMTLFEAGNEALKNSKKAMAITQEFLDSNNNLPSGNNLEDYLDHVLREMYNNHFKKTKDDLVQDVDDDTESLNNDKKEAENQEENSSVPPSGWFFKGFWAFYLFGPFPKDNELSTLLTINDLSDFYTNKTVVGRQHARSKRAAESTAGDNPSKAESTSKIPSPFKRGLSVRDRLTATTIAQASDDQKMRKNEQHVLLLTRYIDSLHKSLELAYRRAERTGDYSIADNLEARIEQKRQEMDKIEQNITETGDNEMVTSLLISLQQNASASSVNTTPEGLIVSHENRMEKSIRRGSLSSRSSVPPFAGFKSATTSINESDDEATDNIQKCAAAFGGLCGVGNYIKGSIQHYCFVCKLPLHGGVCGHLLSELPKETKEKFINCDVEHAPVSSLVCKTCLFSVGV